MFLNMKTEFRSIIGEVIATNTANLRAFQNNRHDMLIVNDINVENVFFSTGCLNFLKLCKIKFYNYCLVHHVQVNVQQNWF